MKLGYWTKIKTHIDLIMSGDIIEFNGKMTTVCANNIKSDSFIGRTIFGDSYNSGYKPVIKFLFIKPIDN